VRKYQHSVKGLWRWSVSLCGSSVKGTGREDSLAGDLEGSGDGHLFSKELHLGKLEKGGLSIGEFESWVKGLWERGISLPRGSVEGASGRAPLPGNQNDGTFERYENAL
jgi:hypothetical protein